MTELQKEFEATRYTSWINSDLYPDGKIYTKEYTQWLERQVLALRQSCVVGRIEQLCDLDGKTVRVKFKATKHIPKIVIEDI
jgi:hypothetical protein